MRRTRSVCLLAALAIAANAFGCSPGAGASDSAPIEPPLPEESPPPEPLRLLWMGESIYYTSYFEGTLQWFTTSYWAEVSGRPLVFDMAAFSGHNVGVALVETADETFAYVEGRWALRPRGVSFTSYGGSAFEFGANDAGQLSVADFRRTYDKLLHQLSKAGIPKVCAGVAPPRSYDLVTWSPAPYELGGLGGHYAVLEPLWAKWGVSYTDLVAEFTDLVSSGAYTVAQLSDGVHFRMPAGAEEAAKSIVPCLSGAGPVQAAEPEIPGVVVNDLFGEPTSGTWTLTQVVPAHSTPGQLHRIAGYNGEWVAQATEPGATLRFPPRAARDIWLRFYVDSATGGGFAWYIDRGSPSEISGTFGTLYPPGNEAHPVSKLLATDLPAGPHQVEVETLNDGPVRLQSVTYVGVE